MAEMCVKCEKWYTNQPPIQTNCGGICLDCFESMPKMNEVLLYQKTQTGKIQQWRAWIDPKGESGFPEVWIEHGQTDGKKQTTFDAIRVGKNEGRANETTLIQQAILTLERKAKKQREKGYSENPEDLEGKKIDFAKQLPKDLCFYKPKNSIEDNKLEELEKAGKALFTVKRDGMMHVACMHNDGLQIYSRRMDVVTAGYPHIVLSLQGLPIGTILLGEMIFTRPDGTDDFNLVSRICRSDPEKALARQKEFGQLSFYMFDMAFFQGENLLTTKPYRARHAGLQKLVDKLGSPHLLAAETLDMSHVAAMQHIKKRKLEGIVVFDHTSVMETRKAFTFNGKYG